VPVVFALGRLHENKAFDTLLRAIAALPGTYLWLAGDGPERDSLKALARELGIADRVHMLGWVDDPAPLFAAADVFVVPSRHEPLGSVLLEGWMHRVPMIAAASQGPKFLVKDGEDGLLVPVDDAPAMAAAIGRVLDDPALARSLRRKGRETFEANYTEAVAVSRYLALFAKVLGETDEKAGDGG
jgi:glycosyltransferase involved in cell wall biosynthesis